MAALGSLQLEQVRGLGSLQQERPAGILRSKWQGLGLQLPGSARLGCGGRLGLRTPALLQDPWCSQLWRRVEMKPAAARCHVAPVPCASASLVFDLPVVKGQVKQASLAAAKGLSVVLARTLLILKAHPTVVQTVPALGLIAFSVWGLGPFVRQLRKTLFQKSEKSWENSLTQYLMASYLRPILLWIGVIVICRAVDPLVLSTEASNAIKQRFVNFVRSLSTVLAFAVCTASLTQQIQKFMMERQDSQEARNVGVQFIGNTVYTSVWVAAVCLFMELLGFSTQKWITAGGFGTVLLTLAGREIFTNFLSSVMIHATRPFVESEWIQTKIEGQEVSGTVEHVGWWSPTVIRGDDREAVHIPNHKFTVSVVRNLTQKSHWRIKTHFGISHLDVNKIKHIVADMRKVLAKHPSVEQHRLHRRVFFDNIDPENQALLILVSCFVKTPHFEEYLRVKEVILLDLLKVISHHHARLATPIRSVQRLMDENESRHSPFRDVTARSETNRPFLLVEAAATSADEDKELVKVKAESAETGADKSNSPKKVSVGVEEVDSISKVDLKDKVVAAVDVKGPEVKEKVIAVAETKAVSTAATVAAAVETPLPPSALKPQLDGLDSMGLNAGDITLLGAAFEKPPAKIPEGPLDSGPYGDISSGDKLTGKVANEKMRVKNGIEKGGTKSSSEQAVTRGEILTSKGTETIQEQTMQNVKRPPGERTPSKSVNEKLATEVKLTDAELLIKETGADKLSPAPSDSISSKGKSDSLGGLENAASDDPWRQQGLPSGVSEKQEYLHQNLRAPSGSGADERVPPLQMPQSLEENVLLGVAIDGPKRTLPLDDELPSTSDQRIQTSGVSSIPRSQSVDDMLILGVALDGSKRTLPLGEDKSPSTEPRELVTPRNGNGGGT